MRASTSWIFHPSPAEGVNPGQTAVTSHLRASSPLPTWWT